MMTQLGREWKFVKIMESTKREQLVKHMIWRICQAHGIPTSGKMSSSKCWRSRGQQRYRWEDGIKEANAALTGRWQLGGERQHQLWTTQYKVEVFKSTDTVNGFMYLKHYLLCSFNYFVVVCDTQQALRLQQPKLCGFN